MISSHIFVVQACNSGLRSSRPTDEWRDMVNHYFSNRELAMKRLNELREQNLTNPNNPKFRIAHRITTEIYYQDDIGKGYDWLDT